MSHLSLAHPSDRITLDQEQLLRGLRAFLAGVGFYFDEDLNCALKRVHHQDLDELPDELRRVAEIVSGVKRTGPMNLVPRTARLSLPALSRAVPGRVHPTHGRLWMRWSKTLSPDQVISALPTPLIDLAG